MPMGAKSREYKHTKVMTDEFSVNDFYFPQNVVQRVTDDVLRANILQDSLGLIPGWYHFKLPYFHKEMEERLILHEELREWCKENIRGDWEESRIDNVYTTKKAAARKDDVEHKVFTGYIMFENYEDAILFKLTWEGDLKFI